MTFDWEPEFIVDATGNITADTLRYWFNSVHGTNAFHTAVEVYTPDAPPLAITSIPAPTGPGVFSLIRLDPTAPEVIGWMASWWRRWRTR